MKLTQQDMARILDITTATLRNWRKNKPNLYKIVMQGFAVEDVKRTLQESMEKIESAGEEKRK
jgi:transcriptional regulator with XRE-family HTH domain